MAKVVVLVSGGVDSAAALGLALEQGLDTVAVHFRISEADKRAEEKAGRLVAHFGKMFGRPVKLVVVPFWFVLESILEKCERRFACVLCKRMMERIAEKIALEENALALVKGDSLGQVASQTLANMNAEKGSAKTPILRPLLGLDKLEIEAIARKFKVLEIGNMPSGCCPIPEKPATSAKRQLVEELEKGLDVEALALKAFGKKNRVNSLWKKGGVVRGRK